MNEDGPGSDVMNEDSPGSCVMNDDGPGSDVMNEDGPGSDTMKREASSLDGTGSDAEVALGEVRAVADAGVSPATVQPGPTWVSSPAAVTWPFTKS